MNTKKMISGFSALMMTVTMLASCSAKAPENTVHTIDDLNGKTIGVQIGTTGDTLAGDIEGATVEKYNKYSDAVQALKQGKIDAVIIDSDTANVFVSKNQDVTILTEGFADEEYAIALNLENDALLEDINDALEDLKEDGTLKAIKDFYDSENAGTNPYTSPADANRSKGKLVMATNAEFPPYEFREGDKITGFDVDMMTAVCDKLGYELQIDDMAFESVIPAVQSGKADVGVAGLSVTPDREKNVKFSDSYTVTHLVVMVRK
ncbi:MAG: transporter substrate-binding domain-containing protein [Oscillospiraceae bacterium]|nr:transporter substrate-binding domain-containing protein [Oscillospiraceae bacterium]